MSSARQGCVDRALGAAQTAKPIARLETVKNSDLSAADATTGELWMKVLAGERRKMLSPQLVDFHELVGAPLLGCLCGEPLARLGVVVDRLDDASNSECSEDKEGQHCGPIVARRAPSVKLAHLFTGPA